MKNKNTQVDQPEAIPEEQVSNDDILNAIYQQQEEQQRQQQLEEQ